MVLSSSVEDIRLYLVVQPKASRCRVVGLVGNELKVAITAPPVDGKANEFLRRYLAKEFKTSPSRITIVRGETSHHKEILISGARVIPQDFVPYIKTEKN